MKNLRDFISWDSPSGSCTANCRRGVSVSTTLQVPAKNKIEMNENNNRRIIILKSPAGGFHWDNRHLSSKHSSSRNALAMSDGATTLPGTFESRSWATLSGVLETVAQRLGDLRCGPATRSAGSCWNCLRVMMAMRKSEFWVIDKRKNIF